MRSKYLISIVSAVMISLTCHAQKGMKTDRFHLSLEWGPSLKTLEFRHYNFLSDEGFRIDDTGVEMDLFINGFADFRVGVQVSEYISLSVGTGIVGYGRKQHVIPAMVRGDYKIRGYSNDGPISFVEAGLGFSPDNWRSDVILARSGIGYRYALGETAGLEMTLGLAAAASHPEIWSNSEMRYIPESDVMRNDAITFALVLGIAIDF